MKLTVLVIMTFAHACVFMHALSPFTDKSDVLTSNAIS